MRGRLMLSSVHDMPHSNHEAMHWHVTKKGSRPPQQRAWKPIAQTNFVQCAGWLEDGRLDTISSSVCLLQEQVPQHQVGLTGAAAALAGSQVQRGQAPAVAPVNKLDQRGVVFVKAGNICRQGKIGRSQRRQAACAAQDQSQCFLEHMCHTHSNTEHTEGRTKKIHLQQGVAVTSRDVWWQVSAAVTCHPAAT